MPAAFAGIGIAVGGFVGVTGMSFATAVVIGVVSSAVVGAAIGGISAAVMGGDIGKGMLFGAVGGVVTGGLAGGMIAPQGYATAQTAQGLGSSASIMTSGGMGGGSYVTTAGASPILPAAGPGGASSGLFGGALSTQGIMSGAAGPLISAVGAGMQGDPEQAYGNTEEGTKGNWEQRLKEIEASKQGHAPNYTREVATINADSALKQIGASAAEDRKAIQLQTEGKIKTTEKEYELSNTNAQAEWDRAMGKLKDAAGVAGQQTYTEGGDYETVLAAQQERGDIQPSRGVLMGYEGEGANG